MANSITMENAEKFVAALQAMPTRNFLKTMIFEAGNVAEARLMLRPAQMGYAGSKGSAKSSSSGNSIVAGKTFWKRGDGAYKVAKDKIKKTTRQRSVGEITGMRHYTYTTKEVFGMVAVEKKRSQLLSASRGGKGAWRRQRSSDSMEVSVVTSVSYAGHVKGGASDDPTQAAVMAKRGWETVDDAAVFVEKNMLNIINNTIQRHYDQWFKKYGV